MMISARRGPMPGSALPLRQIAPAQGVQQCCDRGLGHRLRLAFVVAADFGGVQTRERSRRARGSDGDLQFRVGNPFLNARDLALDEPAHLLQLFLLGRIMMKKGLGEAHRSDREADHVLDVARDGDGQLATAAAEIDQQRPAAGDAGIGEHAEMDEAAFFQSGDDLGFPAGGAAHPIQESAAVARVTQSAGRDYAHAVGGVSLHGAVKAPQHLQSVRHGLRIECAVGKDAFAETRDLAIVVERLQTTAYGLGYLEPDRVRTDINRSEGWHAQ